MSRLSWDDAGKRLYETGVSQGVLYPFVAGAYPKGVAWNGLSAVNESPSGAEPTAIYADNQKYLNLYSVEEFGATIEAYTYPKEFEACDGSAELLPGVTIGQQERQPFGFAYKTVIGNDTEGEAYGYKLHLVYGAKASPSDKNHNTINDSPEAETMSWEISTTPVQVTGMKPTATLVINSTEVTAEQLKAIEDILYGTEGTPEIPEDTDAGTPAIPAVPGVDARLPLPDEILAILKTI